MQYEIVEAYLTEKYLSHLHVMPDFAFSQISPSELQRVTTLTSNDAGLVVVRMPSKKSIASHRDDSSLVLVLDGINDP
jgi:tRNA G18 (ribose-2'-O)-methylase SpoU